MKLTLLKYKKLIIVFSFFFFPLIFISVFKVDYNLTAPGYNDNVNGFIEVDSDFESKGSFHTTSIISLKGITYLQYWLGSKEDKVFVSPFPEYYDNIVVSDLKVMSYLMKNDSLYTSLIVGISNTGYEIDYESFLTVYLTWNYLEDDTLEIGDKIVDVKKDGVSIDVSDIECEDTVVFTVLRGEDVLDFELTKNLVSETTCGIGIYTDIFSNIIDTEVEYNLIETLTSGPSGGLMQSLYIYNQLTSFDYTNGLKIGGTGTISVDGNVGAIGGVEQKIYTSHMHNIDIFFVPFAGGNYDNAMKAYENFNTNMIIVGVDTFSDAVNYLLNYQGGDLND
jgi:PDZ domain-containing protein